MAQFPFAGKALGLPAALLESCLVVLLPGWCCLVALGLYLSGSIYDVTFVRTLLKLNSY